MGREYLSAIPSGQKGGQLAQRSGIDSLAGRAQQQRLRGDITVVPCPPCSCPSPSSPPPPLICCVELPTSSASHLLSVVMCPGPTPSTESAQPRTIREPEPERLQRSRAGAVGRPRSVTASGLGGHFSKSLNAISSSDVTMSPASLAHFKNRVPTTSSSGACTEPNLPPAKRLREGGAAVGGERVQGPAGVGRGSSVEDIEKSNHCVARGNTPPDIEKARYPSGKAPTDAEFIVPRGHYDLSNPKMLDCSICNNPLFLPIYQCKNGHTACPTCWSNFEKARRNCHSCSEAHWNIRCLVLEKVLEHLSVRCSHAPYGCKEYPKFLNKREHEEEHCKYIPYKCPIDECSYKGPKPALLQHFDKGHQMQAVQLDMRVSRKVEFTMMCTEKYKLVQNDQSELYFIYHEVMAGGEGDIFYCASFGPYKRKYFLKVELKVESRFHVVKASIPEMKHLETWRLKRDHLVVPNSVQVDPRSNCQFDLELELYGGIAPPGHLA